MTFYDVILATLPSLLLAGFGLHAMFSNTAWLALILFGIAFFSVVYNFVGFKNLPLQIFLITIPYYITYLLVGSSIQTFTLLSWSPWLTAALVIPVVFWLGPPLIPVLLDIVGINTDFDLIKETSQRCKKCGGKYRIRISTVGGGVDLQCYKCGSTYWVGGQDACVYCGSKFISVKLFTSTGTPRIRCWMCGHKRGPKE